MQESCLLIEWTSQHSWDMIRNHQNRTERELKWKGDCLMQASLPCKSQERRLNSCSRLWTEHTGDFLFFYFAACGFWEFSASLNCDMHNGILFSANVSRKNAEDFFASFLFSKADVIHFEPHYTHRNIHQWLNKENQIPSRTHYSDYHCTCP